MTSHFKIRFMGKETIEQLCVAKAKMHELVAAVALIFTLTGCASTPHNERPKVDLPDHFADQHNAAASDPMIDRAWWAAFNDPTLDDLVQQTLAHNADLQAALARVENAEAVIREISGAMFPTITAQTSSIRNRVSQVDAVPLPATAPALRNTHNIGLATSFELDIFGRLRSATAAARADLLATRYAHDSIRLTLIGLTTQYYFALRSSDTQLALLNELRTNRASRHTVIRYRYEGGLSSALDVHQSEAAIATLDTRLAVERQNHAIIEHQLALLTGTPGLTLPSGHLANLPVPPTPPVGLPSKLLEARPDIQQAEASLESAQARIALARAAYFPTIGLTGVLGSESQSLSDLFSTGATIWSLGLNATMAIFDAGRNAAREDEATARQHEILANYVKSVQVAFQEVSDALATLHENTLAAQANSLRIEAAQKALTLTDYRYQAGYVGYLDVLDAQQSVVDAQQSAIAAKQGQLNATVALFKALGGGWRKTTITQD